MGHSGCGGVNVLFHRHDNNIENEEYSFIAPWVDILAGARESVKEEMAHLPVETQIHACEQRSILISLENLKSFPFVQRAIDSHNLNLHAWYFDIGESALYQHDEKTGRFEITI
jgi:carbonic anhydrase